MTITEPGRYTLPEDEYHADPVEGGSLSVSGAKRLLVAPALYKHERDHGRPPKAAFDIGHAVHSMVLGVGAPIDVVEADDWRGKAAREAREAAYADGRVPLLTADHEAASEAADAVLTHPLAGPLFTDGEPEESWFWQDRGIWRRARTDWRSGSTVVDLKTCQSAEPSAVAKAVANFGYHMQHAWYVDTLAALGIPDARFLFVFVEKTAPYLVTVVELDEQAVRSGRVRNDRAVDVYAECVAFDSWPGYADDIVRVGLPGWAA